MNFWGQPKQLPPPGDWATWVTRYCDMLGALYYELAKEQADPRRWDEPTVAKIERERRAALDLARLPERQIGRAVVSLMHSIEKRDVTSVRAVLSIRRL